MDTEGGRIRYSLDRIPGPSVDSTSKLSVYFALGCGAKVGVIVAVWEICVTWEFVISDGGTSPTLESLAFGGICPCQTGSIKIIDRRAPISGVG